MFRKSLFCMYFCLFILLILTSNSTGEKLERTDDCDFHVTVVRQLEKDGFHREVHSLVELVGGYSIIQRQHCSLAMRETLPRGLYVNPNQLEDLARLGLVQACAETSVDVEAPEPLSTNLTVLIYSGLERAENLLWAQLVLPVHARYHAPAETGGYRPVTVGTPDLFLRCAGPINCPNMKTFSLPCYACGKELCIWTQLPFKTNTEGLNMLVPVGNMQHYYFVTFLTFSITIGGAIYILSVLANSVENVL